MRHQRLPRMIAPAALALIGVALLASACGSSAPTADQYNSQANSICQTYTAKLKTVTAELALPKAKSDESLQASLSDALSLVQQGTSKLEALSRPDGEGASLDAVFTSQNAQTEKLRDLITAFKEKNEHKVVVAQTALEQSEAPLNQQFDKLGLTACGSGTVPPANGSK